MPRVVKTALVKAEPIFSCGLPLLPNRDTLTKDYLLYGSNMNRSSKGRPYRTKEDVYLCDIRDIVWESVFQHGFLIGGDVYDISDAAREKIQQDACLEDVLPDDVYDAIFFGNSHELSCANPNTDLVVQVERQKITDIRKVLDTVKSGIKRGFFKVVSAYVEKGSGSAYPPYNNNPKSQHFGHAFSTHGAGPKNTRALIGRAAGTRKKQGQWLNNALAAKLINSLLPLKGPTKIEIPEGLGQVINPDGSITQASHALIIPRANGTDIISAFPVD